MLFVLLYGMVSQSRGILYDQILSLPTSRSIDDTTALIGITIKI